MNTPSLWSRWDVASALKHPPGVIAEEFEEAIYQFISRSLVLSGNLLLDFRLLCAGVDCGVIFLQKLIFCSTSMADSEGYLAQAGDWRPQTPGTLKTSPS